MNKPLISQEDFYWMQQALNLADKAAEQQEVPIGAVLIYEGNCVAQGWNQPITQQDATAHAEIVTIRQAGYYFQNYRLINTTLYVTLEPCIMCAGAIIHARIQRVVFGCYDPKTGAAGSRFDVLQDMRHNHQVACVGGVMAEQCRQQLQDFFRAKRLK